MGSSGLPRMPNQYGGAYPMSPGRPSHAYASPQGNPYAPNPNVNPNNPNANNANQLLPSPRREEMGNSEMGRDGQPSNSNPANGTRFIICICICILVYV
jgi:hypothetical protein